MEEVGMKILEYLYKNGNGEFIDVTKVFKKGVIPSKEDIEKAYKPLDKKIEIQAIYEVREMRRLDSKSTIKTPLQKAKITQIGRKYL
jgi:hypothetical protein